MSKKMRVDAEPPTFVVAGPGAGKTYGMVTDVIDALPKLNPHRYLAVITYTNAASQEIRDRLAARVELPRNVFIGTTHSFVARFILKPYARVFGELPEECIYMALEVDGDRLKKNSILKRMREKGVVSYDSMQSIAAKLVTKKIVRERVGQRLQHLFVDEVQDLDSNQGKIIDAIRRTKATRIRVVGDPEQSIGSFQYGAAGLKQPKPGERPHDKLLNESVAETNHFNYRAIENLVEFANQFREDIEQIAQRGRADYDAVQFISETETRELVAKFRQIDRPHSQDRIPWKRLYLAHRNNVFDSVRAEHGIQHLGQGSQHAQTLAAHSRELLCQAGGFPEKKLLEKLQISPLAWRTKVYRLLESCRESDWSLEEFNAFAKEELGEEPSMRRKSQKSQVEKSLLNLKGLLAGVTQPTAGDVSSSIHRSKGLEAEAVLVVASTLRELNKFLERDAIVRQADASDTCRLGYVAATRARDLLCYGCLKPLDTSTKNQLQACGITIAR